MKKNGVILFNPRAANAKFRIPNSILQVGAALEGKFPYAFVDGNREADPWLAIEPMLRSGDYRYFACTVMPGQQLRQAIPFTLRIRREFPGIITVWGGYFATNQHQVALASGAVDYVVAGPGDAAFPALLSALGKGLSPADIPNLIYMQDGRIHKTPKEALLDQDLLPPLPYQKLDAAYPLAGYLGNTILGSRTAAYHSSFGCPFTCSFCAVVPIYNARWRGKSAANIYRDIKFLKERFGANGVEFHDNNFFVSEKRTVEFARLIAPEQMGWWGEARIDTMDKYSDEALREIRQSGCRMIFFGAETGNDAVLQQMNKGGTQTGEQIKRFAERMARFDIIPEYSFVLGTPGKNEAQVWEQIESDISFIKDVKGINPATEIIMYVYSPVPTEGSALFEEVKKAGFAFPEHLEEWIAPRWESFDLRKNPLTPWLTPAMVNRILDFETVLNAYYPTVSDLKVTGLQRKVMRGLSAWRYHSGSYAFPMELRLLQSRWLKYRQPETEGF
ncbi:MAG TPA: radical SAM protein [Calditrichia bacterium]|nr:B12-binding domain-containing radical SAM protein [Calditrichota bacterium]HQV32796.1 radical SAM protein [Calditrichia bacterium]